MGLRSLLKKNEGLVSTTTEEARAQGQVVPTTPLMGQIKGQTPKSADMMGTPANKLKVLQDSVQKYVEKPEPQEIEKKAAEVVQPLIDAEKLPTLNDRVKNLILEKTTAQMEGVAPTNQVIASIDPNKIPATTSKGVAIDKAKVTELLTKLAKKEDVSNTLQELNKALGKDSSNFLTGVEVENFFVSSPEAAALAKQVSDAVSNYGQLTLEEIGLTDTDLQALSNITGKSIEDLKGLNYDGFKNAVTNVRSSYSDTANLQSILNDPYAGQAAKTDAAKQLREMGVVGKAQEETKVNDLIAQVEDNDNINFAGKDMSIEDLLNDEVMSGFIKDAVDSPEGMADLEEVAPVLADWVKANLSAVTDLAKTLEPSILPAKEAVWTKENPIQAALGGTSFNPNPMPELVIPESQAGKDAMLRWKPADLSRVEDKANYISTMNRVSTLLTKATPSTKDGDILGNKIATLLASGKAPTPAELDKLEREIIDTNDIVSGNFEASAIPVVAVLSENSTQFSDSKTMGDILSRQGSSDKLGTIGEELVSQGIKESVIDAIGTLSNPPTANELAKISKSLVEQGIPLSEITSALNSFNLILKDAPTPKTIAKGIEDKVVADKAENLRVEKEKELLIQQMNEKYATKAVEDKATATTAISTAKTEIDQIQSNMVNTSKELETLRTSITNKAGELQATQNAINTLDKEPGWRRSSAWRAERDRLGDQYNQLATELTQLKSSKEIKDTQVAEWKKAIPRLQRTIDDATLVLNAPATREEVISNQANYSAAEGSWLAAAGISTSTQVAPPNVAPAGKVETMIKESQAIHPLLEKATVEIPNLTGKQLYNPNKSELWNQMYALPKDYVAPKIGIPGDPLFGFGQPGTYDASKSEAWNIMHARQKWNAPGTYIYSESPEWNAARGRAKAFTTPDKAVPPPTSTNIPTPTNYKRDAFGRIIGVR